VPPSSDETICILLATYNGERFLGDQLDSLMAQTYTNWKLFVRDDGSTDGTIGIIERAAKDKRVFLVDNSSSNAGSRQNFATLLDLSRDDYEYFMFCDQDDVWLPEKIEETLAEMRKAEQKHGNVVPLLVYTNFQYVYNDLKIIKSKKNFRSTKVSHLRFAHLLAQNPAYGCTMMFNRSLAETVGHIPPQAENHDYWIALVAAAFGKIIYYNNPTILYRQHNNNISTNYDSSSTTKRWKRIVLQRKHVEDVRKKMIMALSFEDIYLKMLSKEHKRVLKDFIGLFAKKGIGALFKNIQNGVRRQTLLQTILFYITVLMLPKNDFKNKTF
jgi:rhamnosyltransferase